MEADSVKSGIIFYIDFIINGQLTVVVYLLCYVWLFVTLWTVAHQISEARLLEWVAISFSMGSSQPRNPTCVSCIGKWILYHWATREAPSFLFIVSSPHLGNSLVFLRLGNVSACGGISTGSEVWIGCRVQTVHKRANEYQKGQPENQREHKGK